jgi:flagella basal body P-ring formation protein FlgA
MNFMNRTSNIEHRTLNSGRKWNPLRRSAFDVRGSKFLFTVLTSLATFSLYADEPSPAPAAAPATAAAVAPAERSFDQSDLVELLKTTLQQDYVKDKGELEINFTQPWASRKVSDDPLTIKILEMPTIGVSSSFIVRFELRNEHGSIGAWQLPVRAHVWHDAWVAHAMLKRGDSLADADVTRERRDLLVIHESLADFTPGDSTLQITEPVGIGAPLFARSIKPMPVIHRGQTVNALIEQGTLNITMKVEVLEDGAPGQIVRARNQQSLRDIRGKVLNEQTILVSL